ncbi:PilZ domain-containing protein [Cohnella nanjingensis]|uniref:PilZ domain-containing protein n=1 Tax=Cohnella nanjingensis TaxID=1387779 RepID=A0A7X0RRZ2_9BACL|nr:PilZ domain-containing protein [Cohnella nanjingensis]MBB6672572.1 PilZ domain-containing protein [Cohnella nanjingensis]
MVQEGALRKKGLAGGDRDLPPLKVLLHCRTVVERKNFVTTGIMTQVEGELLEIELHEYQLFELGETVKLTVYSPAGIQSFQSIVLAKYEGAIATIQPPALHQKFQEKREHYRVEASGTGLITHVSADKDEQPRLLPRPLEVQIKDISVGGIGFAGPDLPEFKPGSLLRTVVNVGFSFACDLEIMRRERTEDGVFCGTRLTLLDPDMTRQLRAFLLRQQVQALVRHRNEANAQKKFKG